MRIETLMSLCKSDLQLQLSTTTVNYNCQLRSYRVLFFMLHMGSTSPLPPTSSPPLWGRREKIIHLHDVGGEAANIMQI